MFTRSTELRNRMWNPLDRCFQAAAGLNRSDQTTSGTDNITVATPAHLMVDGELPPSATIDVSVDLDTDTITWTLSNRQSLSMQVPNLRKTHAYVDLTTNTRATIIQHPNPWLF
jgi:hypothetical protein